MCYQSVHIKNNSSHFRGASMPLYYDVPCGHCEECRQSMRSEWFLRSFFEWKKVRSLGGQGYFFTLTYNDEHLPSYDGLPCFSRRDIQLFCKRLKENLKRKYNVNCTYLVTCEFGTIRFRPHYHALFFIDKTLFPHLFFNLVESLWRNGFVYGGSNSSVLSSPNGILYVTKYISKDFSFTDNSDKLRKLIHDKYSQLYHSVYEDPLNDNQSFPSDFDSFCRLSSAFKDTALYSIFKAWHRDILETLPFNAHSLRYGYDLLSHLSSQNIDSENIYLPTSPNPYPLPRFAKRSLFYVKIPDKHGKLTLYRLNSKGVEHKCNKLESDIDNMSCKLKSVFSTLRLTDFQFALFSKRSYLHFESNKELRFFLDNLDVDFRKMATYVIVYRNIRFHGISDPFNKDVYISFYRSRLIDLSNNYNIGEPLSWADSRSFLKLQNSLSNYAYPFTNYELLFRLFSELTFYVKKEAAYFKREQEILRRKTKEMFNNQLQIKTFVS